MVALTLFQSRTYEKQTLSGEKLYKLLLELIIWKIKKIKFYMGGWRTLERHQIKKRYKSL